MLGAAAALLDGIGKVLAARPLGQALLLEVLEVVRDQPVRRVRQPRPPLAIQFSLDRPIDASAAPFVLAANMPETAQRAGHIPGAASIP